MEHLITSAALYYAREDRGGVPLQWFEAISAFLAEKGLPVRIFVADAAGLNFESYYELAKDGQKLVQSLQDGRVKHLFLYSVSGEYDDVEFAWVGQAVISHESGDYFLGVRRTVIDSPGLLLEAALALAKDLPPIRYAIGYHRRQSKGPFFYAVGCGFNTDFSDPVDMAESERMGEWGRELCGHARHLTGMFRGAYPASILSDEHVDAVLRKTIWGREVTLRNAGLGTLKPLKQGLWLWELSEAEIPKAEAALEKAGLIIHN